MCFLFVVQLVRDDVTCEKFSAVLHPYCSDCIVQYDEHVYSNTYKFGVVCQNAKQVREEEMFGNKTHSVAMQRFLELIGQPVKLRDFAGCVHVSDVK